MKKHKEKISLKLRPHHVFGYLGYVRNPKANHFAEFRKAKGNFHSNKLVNHWINTLKILQENPSLKIKYVSGIDSICKECEHKEECHNPKHNNFNIVKEADQYATKNMPELKIGNIYEVKFIERLFNKKGWL